MLVSDNVTMVCGLFVGMGHTVDSREQETCVNKILELHFDNRATSKGLNKTAWLMTKRNTCLHSSYMYKNMTQQHPLL